MLRALTATSHFCVCVCSSVSLPFLNAQTTFKNEKTKKKLIKLVFIKQSEKELLLFSPHITHYFSLYI